MRYLHHIIYIALAALLTVGCDHENDISSSLIFTPDCDLNPTFCAEGETKRYFFTALYEWEIETADEWVHATPSSGTTLDNTFDITVDGHTAGEARSSSVTIRMANGTKFTMPINQLMHERFDTDPTELYVIDHEATTLEIDIATNMEYEVIMPQGAQWITLIETRSMRDETLHFNIDRNLSHKSRVAVVTARDVRYDKPTLHSFTVVQAAYGEPTNEIIYHTSDNKPLELNTTENYGSKFAIHLFEQETGRIIFNDDVRVIPEHAFAEESTLCDIVLPENVVAIENDAFYNCIALSDMLLPDCMRNIGDRAFAYCIGINEFTLPDSVTTLGGSIFEGCSGEITINCAVPSQEYRSVNGVATADARHWLSGSSFAKATVNNILGKAAFLDYTPLKELVINATCSGVDNMAFEGCNIERVIASSLTAWCKTSFANASANPLHTGNNSLIIDSETLTTLITPAEVKSINNYTFYNYQLLESITLHDDVYGIGQGSFGNCNVTTIYLGNSISAVGNKAFDGCRAKNVTINFNLPSFENGANKSNHWLYGLDAETITIGESVDRIGVLALAMLNFNTLVVSDTVTHVDRGAFAYCANLKDVTLGKSITTLGEHTFFECTSIESITLPESLIHLQGYAFSGCSALATITIPANVTNIGEYCFANCLALNEVYCQPTTPPTLGNNYAFPHGDIPTIYVPSSSLQAYLQADGWRVLKTQLEGYEY